MRIEVVFSPWIIYFYPDMKDAAYFISDAHLGIPIAGGEEREADLLRFLEEITPRAAQLFIVGDLFDFWIEYRRAIRPDYFRVLAGLYDLARSGTEIHYCLGNHDFAIGPFIEKAVGVTVHREGFVGIVQGKKLHVTHGDVLRAADRGNLILRKILQNRGLQALYKLIHPDIGIPLGEFISRFSRKYLVTEPSEEILEAYREAAERLLRAGSEIVVAGHTHVPEICDLPSGRYCNTGNWIHRRHYALMEKGRIRLQIYGPS